MDVKRFGVLPYPGGTFEQPAEFMDELRLAADVCASVEAEELRSRQQGR